MEFAKRLEPSARGELEITDLNRMYLEDGSLSVTLLHRGSAWLDTGTTESLFQASEYVRALEVNQGLQIASLEEIAYNAGWIDREAVARAALKYGKTAYGKHLENVLAGRVISRYTNSLQ